MVLNVQSVLYITQGYSILYEIRIVHGPLREFLELKVLENGFFGHPEVKDISLLMLLYAGKASISSFKYSISPKIKNIFFKDIVKILKQ